MQGRESGKDQRRTTLATHEGVWGTRGQLQRRDKATWNLH